MEEFVEDWPQRRYISIFRSGKAKKGIENNEEVSTIYGKKFEEPIETANNITIESNINQEIKERNSSHYKIFKNSMKYILTWGQIWGLMPVDSILNENPLNVRFRKNSVRFWYSFIIFSLQAGFTFLLVNYLISTGVTLKHMGLFFFYGLTSLITLSSIRMATKWPTLIQELSSANLDLYPRLQFKCKVVFIVFLINGIVEHAFSNLAAVTNLMDCVIDRDIFQSLIDAYFRFVFVLGIPYSVPFGIFLLTISSTATMIWNYNDILIISLSLYLSSVLAAINKKMRAARDKNVPSESWRNLREEYTRASNLVRLFDDAMGPMLLVSFATNLLFICLQLFYILSNGMRLTKTVKCPNYPSGIFNGYEFSIYYVYSLTSLVSRALSVALFTADVHYASLTPAYVLYDVPYSSYCDEVQRFVDQVHGDMVALSGLDFFYMTRELILSVGGAIVTYELVLLQFHGDIMLSSLDSTISIPNSTKV